MDKDFKIRGGNCESHNNECKFLDTTLCSDVYARVAESHAAQEERGRAPAVHFAEIFPLRPGALITVVVNISVHYDAHEVNPSR